MVKDFSLFGLKLFQYEICTYSNDGAMILTNAQWYLLSMQRYNGDNVVLHSGDKNGMFTITFADQSTKTTEWVDQWLYDIAEVASFLKQKLNE